MTRSNALRGQGRRRLEGRRLHEAYLAQFDVWDRYDADGDGNFNEPDGYIDHFQAVHAGTARRPVAARRARTPSGATAGTPSSGAAPGPDGAGPHGLQGVKIGGTNFWIGDYTVEPEDGGVGVFSHEFGHDLGLPDLYDTSGNTGGAENSTGFWTLYSQRLVRVDRQARPTGSARCRST